MPHVKLLHKGHTFGRVVTPVQPHAVLVAADSPRAQVCLRTALAQIASLTGYESLTSFPHSFKRWTGLSLSAVRPESGRKRGMFIGAFSTNLALARTDEFAAASGKTLGEESQVNSEEIEERQKNCPADAAINLLHRLEETRLAAQGMDDKLLVYLIETAFFYAREMLAASGMIIEARVPSNQPNKTREPKSKPNPLSKRGAPRPTLTHVQFLK
jgi:hypothetical protein